MSTRVGIAFTPFETRADVVVSCGVLADEAGLEQVGVSEAMGGAAPVLIAQVATATHRVRVMSSVLSVWSRSPAVLAMTAVELQRLSGGRFSLGLGASTPPLTEGLHGVPWESPFARTRSVVVAARALLDGGRVPSPAGGARPLGLTVAPATRVPIALATLAPPAVRMTGELADEWLPFLWPRPRLGEGRRLLQQGASAVARDELPVVTPGVPLATGPDEESSRQVAAQWLVTYLTRMGPVYPRMLRERFGYQAEVDALLAANVDAPAPVLPAASERLAHEVLVMAPHADVPDAIAEWSDAGCDVVVAVLPFGLPAAAVEAAVASLAV